MGLNSLNLLENNPNLWGKKFMILVGKHFHFNNKYTVHICFPLIFKALLFKKLTNGSNKLTNGDKCHIIKQMFFAYTKRTCLYL